MKAAAWIVLAVVLAGCVTATPERTVNDTDCAVLAAGATWALSDPRFKRPRFRDLAPSHAFVGGDEPPEDWGEAALAPAAAPLALRICPQFRSAPLAGRLAGTTFHQRSLMLSGQDPANENYGRLWISRPVYDKDRRHALLVVGHRYGCNLWSVTLTRRSDGGWEPKVGEPWFVCFG